MCTVCGCGTATVEGEKKATEQSQSHDRHHRHDHDHHSHDHDHGHSHDHHHYDHAHHHPHDHDHTHGEGGEVIDFGAGIAGVHVPGLSQERIVRIERDILSKNDAYARDNRALFAAKGALALNIVSSPGSGKTALLVRAINDLKDRLAVAVIEGDQQTSNDAERIRATGAPAIQINTGKGCHLDAHMVGHALEELDLRAGGVLFIENVGNLVCPAAFDLGEAHKVVLLSVTEGEDKPLKYPDMFAAADLMLLNKADLLPHLTFDVGACLANALKVNPHLQTLVVSATSGEGLAAFYAWIEARAAHAKTHAGAARAG
ncbi:hydrogenase nickel incorporation protein HypB [Methylocystis parvus]|uniref:Hydrogenase maturation factor HypB n=1 Tax=Methylocystis parvus TaxID=134 RepID=A0A6B8M7V1_9HYPH|nr:hydrogenase nickel incorporation protein HypB [Methylocystis parvus]QGM96810.1 hydrogenase nickel incorporation protein HypB [Methylocystis parvus]WBJ99312.1 hydrogenase nickel incorporation protein HypB [Methylocystis parvus OBBP]